MNESVLIIGVGSGLSASLARLCASKNMTVVLAARNTDKLQGLKKETNAIIVVTQNGVAHPKQCFFCN